MRSGGAVVSALEATVPSTFVTPAESCNRCKELSLPCVVSTRETKFPTGCAACIQAGVPCRFSPPFNHRLPLLLSPSCVQCQRQHHKCCLPDGHSACRYCASTRRHCSFAPRQPRGPKPGFTRPVVTEKSQSPASSPSLTKFQQPVVCHNRALSGDQPTRLGRGSRNCSAVTPSPRPAKRQRVIPVGPFFIHAVSQNSSP